MPDTGRSPIEPRTAKARGTAETALIWLGTAALFWLTWKLANALLVIFAGLVFAAGLQAAEQALGRHWKTPHGVRLAVVVILFFGLVIGFLTFAGLTLVAQSEMLGATLRAQFTRLDVLAAQRGIDIPGGHVLDALKVHLSGQYSRVLPFVGSAVGAIGAALLIAALGIYVAADPRLYERGVEWLTPESSRDSVADTIGAMAHMLRRWLVGRLLTMSIEGVFIFIGLSIIGLPIAGLLALVSGLLAFIPTLGAMISGTLIVIVGFSVGPTEGLWAIGIYLAVQLLEGNVLTPLIEKRAVDLAPAVVLAAQLLFGVLFGILGVALADPIVALAKVALERRGRGPVPTPPDGKRL